MGKSSKNGQLRQRSAAAVAPDKPVEEETVTIDGKTYKKRKHLPDVGYLLQYGLPGEEGKKPDPNRKWYEDFVLPGILLLVFILSLVIFHNIPFGQKIEYTLPKMPDGPSVNMMGEFD